MVGNTNLSFGNLDASRISDVGLDVSNVVKQANSQNLQGVIDGSFASAASIAGGEAGQKFEGAGAALNSIQNGNLQGAMG